MKSRFLCVSAAVVSLALMAGCSGGGSTTGGEQVDPSSATGTVRLWGWGTPVEESLMKQMIAEFEKAYPQVTVDYRVIEGDYPAAMTAAFAARKPPDVFYVDSSLSKDWIDQDVLEPLDGYIEQNSFDTTPFYPSLVDTFRSTDGTLYGLPKDWSPLATVTNTALVEDAGLAVPTNWQELEAVAKQVDIPDGRPVCLANDWARWLPWVLQNGGSFLNADGTAVTINSAQAAEAFNFWIGLNEAGLVGSPEQLGVGWCGEALGKGKAAIAFEGNWVVSFLDSTYPDLKYALHPFIEGTQKANMAFTVSYSMAADSQNKPAAWLLLSYLVGKDGMEIWTSQGLALPSRSDVAPLPGKEVFTDQADVAHGWVLTPNFSTVSNTANNDLTAVVSGEKTVEEMLDDVEQAATTALEG